MKTTRPEARDPSYQTVMKAAKELGRFTRADLVHSTGLSSSVVGQQVRRMMDRKEIVVVRKDAGVELLEFHTVTKLVVDRSSPEAALWTAMRTMRRFEPIDLITALKASDADVDLDAAKRYCNILLKARYLRCISKAVTGRRDARYTLTIDSGPLPPVQRRMTVLVDPNEERVAWVPAVTS